MKTLFIIVFCLLFVSAELVSQEVYGRLVDENGAALAEVQLKLYTPTNIYTATSGLTGTFIFNIITGVEENSQLPRGYSVSDNFPNPFNPITRLAITLPSKGNVRIEVFNLLGQTVADVVEQNFDAGTNYIDLELNGLPNGFYISRITIDDKYTVVKKMMLIYGSQHLITSGGTVNRQLNKSNNFYFDINLDSLVATSSIIGRKTFKDLPSFVSGTLGLGNLIIERYCPDCPTVLYEGKIYHTIQIGSQCWLKENLNVGIMIQESQDQTNNGIIEKYCYNDDPTYCNTFGGLYQWDETMQYVNTPGTQGICPPGWHIPTIAEFQTLDAAINGNGNSLKAIGQGSGVGAGTNASGFSALLAGIRDPLGGFAGKGIAIIMWSSIEKSVTDANDMVLRTYDSLFFSNDNPKNSGFSIRCIKD